MKNIIFLFVIVALFAFNSPKPLHFAKITDTIISKQELTDIIDTLSSDYYEGREIGTKGIEKAAIYIENYLKKANIAPFFKTYRDSILIEDIYAFNIVGLIEGTDPALKNEFVILSAHYDHIGKAKNKTDSVYNGANDNATGVSTVLNIAKIIAENKLNKRSIIVVLFSAEEIGLAGSEHFANTIKAMAPKTYCAVNIDMIGSLLTNQPEKVYLSGYKKSNMAEIFNKYIENETVVYWDKEEGYALFYLSDNFPLYYALKIPAHTFSTFDFTNYEHYHNLTDEVSNINTNNTCIIAENIRKGFIKLINADEREIILKPGN